MFPFKKVMPISENASFDDLIQIIVDAVSEYQAADDTIKEYKYACLRFKTFAEEHSSSVFTQDLYESFLKQLSDKLENKKICYGHYRFLKRVARIIAHLAQAGELDFSYAHLPVRKYPVNNECSLLIESAINENNVTEKQRNDFIAPMRHLLWYGYEHGYTLETFDDEIVMQFLIQEVPITNSGSTGRTLRCVKYLTAYMQKHNLSHIKFHYNDLVLKNSFVKIIPAFSEEEINDITGAIDTNTKIGKRDLAIILLGYGCGIRGVDIVNLTNKNIDWKKHSLQFVQSKTGKHVVLPLNGEIMNAIADYILEARPNCESDRLFLTVRAPFRPLSASFAKMIDSYCEKAGIEKIPLRAFHSLRRGFETVLSEKGVPIEDVSYMVGHQSIEEDKPYISYNKEKASLVALSFDEVPITEGVYMTLSGINHGGEVNT